MPTVELSDLQGRLRTCLGFPSTDTTALSNADALTFLNLALRDIQTDIDLYWCEKNTTYSIAVGAGATTIGDVPSDYNRMIVFWILDDATNSSNALGRIDRITFVEQYPPLASETSGTPSKILRFGKALFVRPIADKAYTLRLDYLGYLTDLSASTDDNDITNNLSSCVVERAAYLLSSEGFGGLRQDAEGHQEKYLEHLARWHKHNTAERVAGASYRMKPPHSRRR